MARHKKPVLACSSAATLVALCRAIQRWAGASADFGRRHNPVKPIVHSKTLNRLKGWRPFNREGQAVLYKDEATSTKGDGDTDSGLSQLEGGVGHLVMYLMPQVFIVAIFRKARQVHACNLAAHTCLLHALRTWACTGLFIVYGQCA